VPLGRGHGKVSSGTYGSVYRYIYAIVVMLFIVLKCENFTAITFECDSCDIK
jgi:hypothetical protein